MTVLENLVSMVNRVPFWLGCGAIASVLSLSGSAVANESLNIQPEFQKPVALAQSAMVKQDAPHQMPPMFNPGFGGPAEGAMPGRGLTTGSIFTLGRQSDAFLTFNNTGGYSLSLAARYAPGLEVNYSGTITRRLPGTRGVNGFVLETQIDRFASSQNGMRVVNTTGTCRIEVFDSLVVIADCTPQVRDGATQFRGMEQF